MTSEGKNVSLHRVDKGGGHFPGGASGVLNPTFASNLSGGNPGTITLIPPADIARYGGVLGAGPWSATIVGVTGVNESEINGERTLTRTGDFTATIGVNTGILVFDPFDGDESVEDINWVDNDDDVPSRQSNDYSHQ